MEGEPFIPQGLEHLGEEDIERLIAIDGLMRARGMPIDDLERASRLNAWNGFYKDNDGEAHKVTMAGIELRPDIQEEDVDFLRPEPARYTRSKTRPKNVKGYRRHIILPDMQAGWGIHPEGYESDFVPTHDEKAISTAFNRIKDVQPYAVGMNGDNIDFPELSDFSQEKRFINGLEFTLDGVHHLMANGHAMSPESKWWWLEGNHEWRLQRQIGKAMMQLLGVKRPGEKHPVLSVPHLLRLDDIGINFLDGYPANEKWITDRLKAIHGKEVKSSGSTAAKIAMNGLVSVIFGHVHRREYHARRVELSPTETRTVVAASGGCLADLNGNVSSHGSAVNSRGREMRNVENWNHGWIEILENGETEHIQLVEMNDNYEAVVDDKVYRP